MTSPPQAVAVISDLHLALGAGWSLEDFYSDAHMGALIDVIKVRFAGKRVDLVLLGDVFDLWQVVPATDLTAPDAVHIDLAWNLPQLRQDLTMIAQGHSQFFQALAEFGQGIDNRLVIVAGNHDHPLILPELQSHLKNILVGQFGFPDRGDNLVFPRYHFYHAPHLGIYAEHGNQYERFNRYADFFHFGPDLKQDECQGYGLVRLFWNRMENLDQDIDDRPEYWGSWFGWLRRHLRWGTLVKAWEWYQEYLLETRVEPISIDDYMKEAALAVPSATGEEHPETPEILLNAQDRNPDLLFSQDLLVEAAYRELYHQDPAFRRAVDQILQKKFAPGPVPAVSLIVGVPALNLDAPGTLIHPGTGEARSFIQGEPLVRSLRGMFTPGQGPDLFRDDNGQRSHLDPQIYKLVIMGHTHDPRWEAVPRHSDKLYINTGTWTTYTTNGRKTERTVILAEELPSHEVWVEGGIISDAGAYYPQRRQRIR